MCKQRSLAAARRADDPEELPVANLEAHPTERAHAALAGRELLGYTANNNFHVKDFGDLTAQLVVSPSAMLKMNSAKELESRKDRIVFI